MHQHHTDTQTLQQGNIMHCAVEVAMQNRITAESDNKGFAPVGMDIRRGLAKELYIGVFIHPAIIPRVASQAAPQMTLRWGNCPAILKSVDPELWIYSKESMA